MLPDLPAGQREGGGGGSKHPTPSPGDVQDPAVSSQEHTALTGLTPKSLCAEVQGAG